MVDDVGKFEVQVEFIGNERDILNELKSASKIMNVQEEELKDQSDEFIE
jgi:hypothetical protein